MNQTPIFRDDSTPADRREAARKRLTAMCPAPLRLTMQPLIDHAVSQASDAEISALMIDVDRVIASAESGDIGAIADIARRYGASDGDIATYLPMAR